MQLATCHLDPSSGSQNATWHFQVAFSSCILNSPARLENATCNFQLGLASCIFKLHFELPHQARECNLRMQLDISKLHFDNPKECPSCKLQVAFCSSGYPASECNLRMQLDISKLHFDTPKECPSCKLHFVPRVTQPQNATWECNLTFSSCIIISRNRVQVASFKLYKWISHNMTGRRSINQDARRGANVEYANWIRQTSIYIYI